MSVAKGSGCEGCGPSVAVGEVEVGPGQIVVVASGAVASAVVVVVVVVLVVVVVGLVVVVVVVVVEVDLVVVVRHLGHRSLCTLLSQQIIWPKTVPPS